MTRTSGDWLITIAILLAWLASFIAARWLIPTLPHGSPAAIAVALATVIPTALVLWRIIAGVRSMDELNRKVQLEALAIAFPLAILMLWTLGLLELAVDLNPKDWSYRHVWVYLPLFYFIGLAIAWRRYR